MSYDDDDRSVQNSRPVELYVISSPTHVRYLTSRENDFYYSSKTYTAVPMARSAIQVVDVHTDASFATITLPADHEICQEYANGVPPAFLRATIRRAQVRSGASIQLWDGYVSSLTFKGRVGTFRIPDASADVLTADVPSVCAQRLCNHVLFDARCTIARGAFMYASTLTVADPLNLQISGSVVFDVQPDAIQWADFGQVIHVLTGERRPILKQTDVDKFTIAYPFPSGTVAAGHQVQILAGCDHLATTCRDKFSNIKNHGGHPQMPTSNVFIVGLLASRS